LAKRKREQYKTFQVCFGQDHTAVTFFVVGKDITYKFPQVHVYQEGVDISMYEALGMSDVRKNLSHDRDLAIKMGNIKKKDLEGLDRKDPVERIIAKRLEKHQDALRNFYPTYVESILLGFVPDLQFWKDMEDYDVGLLFSSNLGFVKEDGQEVVKFFDFGEPRVDFLTLDSRQRLKRIIEKRKEKGILPIYQITRQDVDDQQTIETPFLDLGLAGWYEKALRQELEISLKKKKPVGLYKEELTDAEAVNKMVEKIKAALGITPYKTRYTKDLQAFQRLCGADVYATDVKVIYDNRQEPVEISVKIGKNLVQSLPIKDGKPVFPWN